MRFSSLLFSLSYVLRGKGSSGRLGHGTEESISTPRIIKSLSNKYVSQVLLLVVLILLSSSLYLIPLNNNNNNNNNRYLVDGVILCVLLNLNYILGEREKMGGNISDILLFAIHIYLSLSFSFA